MRQVAGSLRLDMSQYRELQAFAAFGTSDLDVTTRRQIERGQRTVEVLKQPQYRPLSLPQEVEILFAVTSGQLDDVPVDRVRAFETAFQAFMDSNHLEIGQKILSSGEISDETREALTTAIREFKQAGLY
jgi:F-type H+-transporting ATPase subunit alpha